MPLTHLCLIVFKFIHFSITNFPGWKVDSKMMEVLLVALPKQDRLVSIKYISHSMTVHALAF